MKVVVIGCGVIGLTSAYCLRQSGHEVMLIDRRCGPGCETSFANGALLTPSMSEPWSAPGSGRVLLGSLLRSDAPLQLRLRALPTLIGWGTSFLRNSRVAAFERNTRSNLRLALYSLQVMETLQRQTAIEYGRTARGSLRIFRGPATLERACVAAGRLTSEGIRFQRLSPDELVLREPALSPIADQLVGAIHYACDETGNAYQYCVALTDYLRTQGVEFHFGTAVTLVSARAGRVALVAEGKRVTADCYVVAAGSYSTSLLQPVGIHLPVRPAKGYSVTFDRAGSEAMIRIPVVDDELHAAVVPLEGAIRVAGTAEFAGYDLTLSPPRIQNLVALLQKIFPLMQVDPAAGRAWCGLRALSSDGVPMIGATALSNLYVNSGHGHLGWTMAAGSAQLLADLISGRSPSVDPTPYSLGRLAL